jgi:hypothetical protein
MPSTIAIYEDLEIAVPDDARTHAGFRAWARSDAFPDRGRITFIDGQVQIDMSSEEIETHGKPKLDRMGLWRYTLHARRY